MSLYRPANYAETPSWPTQLRERLTTVRWRALFDDLESRADAEQAAELAAEVADRTRREVARLGLADRLRPSLGCSVTVALLGGGTARGTLDGVGPDWLLLAESPAAEALVPMAAVASVAGLVAWSAEPGSEGRVAVRLGLAHALRGIARSRGGVAVELRDNAGRLSGVVDRVGADYVEIAVSDDAVAWHRAPADRRVVPFAAISVVRRRP